MDIAASSLSPRCCAGAGGVEASKGHNAAANDSGGHTSWSNELLAGASSVMGTLALWSNARGFFSDLWSRP